MPKTKNLGYCKEVSIINSLFPPIAAAYKWKLNYNSILRELALSKENNDEFALKLKQSCDIFDDDPHVWENSQTFNTTTYG